MGKSETWDKKVTATRNKRTEELTDAIAPLGFRIGRKDEAEMFSETVVFLKDKEVEGSAALLDQFLTASRAEPIPVATLVDQLHHACGIEPPAQKQTEDPFDDLVEQIGNRNLNRAELRPIDYLIRAAITDRAVAADVIKIPNAECEFSDNPIAAVHWAELLRGIVAAGGDEWNIQPEDITEYRRSLTVTPMESAAITGGMRAIYMQAVAQKESATAFQIQSWKDQHQSLVAKKQAKAELVDRLTSIKEGRGQHDHFAEPIPFDFGSLPSRVQILASYLARSTHEQIRIRHIMCAAVIMGAVIGKSAEIQNWGSEYYCNLAVAILLPSGGNKSGLYTIIKKLTRDLIAVTTPTTSTIEGFLDHFCSHLPVDKKRSAAETKVLARQLVTAHQADFSGNLVLVDEFRAMLLTLLPREQSVRNGQILCRLLDRDDIQMQTATGGTRILGDCCFSWLGFSQTDPWNQELRTAAFQTGGLAARIIPINGQRFDIVPVEPLPVGLNDAIRVITGLSEVVNGDFNGHKKIAIEFTGDGLTAAKNWFAMMTPMAEKKAGEADAIEPLESKLLIQSAKLAGIFAIADLDQYAATVDANPWIQMAYPFVGYSHIGNLDHIASLTEQGQILEKIKQVLRRKGPMTQAELARFANMKPAEIYSYLRTLVEAGELKRLEGQRRYKGVVTYTLMVWGGKGSP